MNIRSYVHYDDDGKSGWSARPLTSLALLGVMRRNSGMDAGGVNP